MIAKAQRTSKKIKGNAIMRTSTMQQSFLYVILQGATTLKDKGKGRTKQLPCNNQNFMLSFTGCGDDHTTPRNDQRHKYAKVKYSEYAEDSVYIAKGMYIPKGMYIAKGKYIEYTKDIVYVAEG